MSQAEPIDRPHITEHSAKFAVGLGNDAPTLSAPAIEALVRPARVEPIDLVRLLRDA